ncbi:MAG: hypothetical protein M1834_000932 [Cirrosporium novae-zelandiae]|nr:MAG: hypothetical protein M1834_000932 [Cirrosporium novae-zelandiae]
MLLQFLYWGANVACNVIGVHTVAQAGSRAGTLATINLVPLFIASNFSVAADLLGISLRGYTWIHNSVGVVVFLQGLVHVLISVIGTSLSLNVPFQLYGFLTVDKHPFMITWWTAGRNGEATSLSLLLKAQTGLTKKLIDYSEPEESFLVWIDGPYGSPLNVGDYGSVVMFASGIGIAAQMPYIKELLDGYRNCTVRTRSIHLLWQLTRQTDQEWVLEWMDELLVQDEGPYILHISIFDPDLEPGVSAKPYGLHNRIWKFSGLIDVRQQLLGAITSQKGRMLVTVSAHDAMRDAVRKAVKENSDERLHLVDLVYQPKHHPRFWGGGRV